VPKKSPLHSDAYQRFVDRLRRAREEAGLTQADVADALVVPHSFVSKCELGERRVDFVELVALARLYAKSLDYFADPQPPARPRRSRRAASRS
jgi:transcriptional regulator with XRE-family HTH domain